MKKVFKTIGWLLLIALIVIQFFHPEEKYAERNCLQSIFQQNYVSS